MLWTAAAKGNTDVVRLLLENGVLKNEICNQSSSLFVAVQNRHLETVKELLNSKCDVDLPILPLNQTPIFKAARMGDSEMVAELINAHADVNLADRQGVTPLCVAALEGHTSVVSQLLLAGANVNSVSRVGKTALSYAHQDNKASIAKMITESGCTLIDLSYGWLAVQFKKYLDFAYTTSPDKYNKDDIEKIKDQLHRGLCSGFSKLIVAMPEHQWDCFYLSLKRISTWDGSNKKISEDRELQTIFEENLGNLLWLQNEHNLLSPNSPPSGSSLINFVAEEKTHKEIIFDFGFLLKKHEVENILNTILEDGKKVEIGSLSPIRHAVIIMRNVSDEYVIIDDNSSVGPIKFSSIEDVSSTLYMMLCKDADKNSLIGLNFTVYDAIDSSDKPKYKKIKLDILSSILEERIQSDELNLHGDQGDSALANAIYGKDEETANKLIEYGVQTASKEGGIQPVYLAAQHTNIRILEKLQQSGADLDITCDNHFPIFIAATLGRTEAVKFLIAHGAKINRWDDANGATPLMIAAKNGHLETVIALVEGGADVNQLSRDKRSPLFIACMQGQSKIVDFLLTHGAEIEPEDYRSKPLDIAISRGHLNVVEILVHHGANLTSTNSLNMTPLRFAEFMGQKHVADYIKSQISQMQIGKGDAPFFKQTKPTENKVNIDTIGPRSKL